MSSTRRLVGMGLCLLLSAASARAIEISCSDGLDDDADSAIDCDDSDCALDDACPDVMRPAEVADVRVTRSGDDVALTWAPTTLDHASQIERFASYRVYSGATPSFVPDRLNGLNRVASVATPSATLAGHAINGALHHYLVNAIDARDQEGNARAANVTTPVLTAQWQPDSIVLSWTASLPRVRLNRYRLYQGRAPGVYDTVTETGSATTGTIYGLEFDTFYYFAVTAVDRNGNETPLSNEVVEAVGGTGRIRAMTQGHSVAWGPNPAMGWEPQVPVAFPPGAWTRITMTVTLASYISDTCDCAGAGACGGDEWDRLVSVFLITDESCLGTGCMGNPDKPQLELMRAVTPFGTNTRTGPRRLTMDVTPFASLLSGTRWLGVNISTWSGNGWFTDIDFTMTKDPAQASPKAPATGVLPLWLRGGVSAGSQATTAPNNVTIPAGTTRAMVRFWATGHGGGDSTGRPECIGPADEFCRKTHHLVVDGADAWTTDVWRDCSNACSSWNACGFPSCTYPRAGWCPGEVSCHQNSPCDQDVDLTSVLTPGTHDLSHIIDDISPGGSWATSATLYWYD